MMGLPSGILLSDEIQDLPPRETFLILTVEQQTFWLSQKFYWTEIYAALSRYHCGLPIFRQDWPNQVQESLKADLVYYSKLYQLISFGWGEITEKLGEVLEDPKSQPLTPGELFLILLRQRSIASILPCVEGYSFSPQLRYRAEKKLKTGDFQPLATDGQKELMQLENFLIFHLKKSKDSCVSDAAKECLKALGDIRTIRLKAAHPSRGFLSGGQWIDGHWIPSKRGVRHHPNPVDE